MSFAKEIDRKTLLQAARDAAAQAYAPYSRFRVGAALLFADGAMVSGANVENASYGLSLCAETVAVARALADGRRGGMVAVAISGLDADAISPCGRCRQVLAELAGLDGSDPVVLGEGHEGMREWRLSQLLPDAFGPKAIAPGGACE